MINKHMNIFDILKEADNDNTQNQDTATDDTTSDSAQDTNDDGDMNDDDFNLDTSLDDPSDNEGEETDNSGSDSSDSSSDLDSSSSETGDEETVEANTDMFASLSAEEQQKKILELKRLYSELYNSINDTIDKIVNINIDSNNIEYISSINNNLLTLKQYIHDYILNTFPQNSYLENDIYYNRFLAILHSITIIIEDLIKLKNE